MIRTAKTAPKAETAGWEKPARAVDANGLEHIKRWEGLRLRAYLCPGGAWTIGYGHTEAAGPPAVAKGMVVSAAEAEEILRRDLRLYAAAVERAVRQPLSANQFSALVSFAYNIGIEAFCASRIPALINSGRGTPCLRR